MSEADGTVEYVEKFAYLPTKLSNGTWIWWSYYWLRSTYYEPSMKMSNEYGFPYYLHSVHSYLSQKEYENEQLVNMIKDEGK